MDLRTHVSANCAYRGETKHGVGPDIMACMTMRIAVLALCSVLTLPLAVAQSARAEADDSLSPILVPTLYFGRGQFGTQWFTWVAINNLSEKPFTTPGVTFRIVDCPIPEGCSSSSVKAHGYADLEAQAPGGLILYARKDGPHDLTFTAQFGIYGDQDSITELPIVRESEFTRETITFPVVGLFNSLNPSRVALRIYGIDAQANTKVRVELCDWYAPGSPPVATKVVTLNVPQSPGTPMPIYPAFAQLQLQSETEFPDLRFHSAAYNVRVVPLPLSNGELPRIWAFISTTSNTTQRVHLQRPQ
jgi:hypothetical protein